MRNLTAIAIIMINALKTVGNMFLETVTNKGFDIDNLAGLVRATSYEEAVKICDLAQWEIDIHAVDCVPMNCSW